MVILNEKFEIPSLRDLLEVRVTKAKWDSKTPLQKWSYLYGIGRVSLKFLGFPVFREDPSLYWFSYVFFVYMGIDVILELYTAYNYLLLDGSLGPFLPCTALLVGPLCCVGLENSICQFAYIQVIMSLHSYFQSAPMGYASVTSTAAMFRSLVDFGGRYIHPNENRDKDYTEICSKHIDETVRSFFIKMGLMLLALHGSMVGPIYAYAMHGTKTTMTNVLIPFVERESNTEFVYNVTLASIIGIHGFVGYIGLEVAMALFSDVVTIVPKAIALDFQRLDSQMEKQKLSNWPLRHTINNIIKQALDSDEYDFCF